MDTQKKLELFDILKSLQEKASDGTTWSYHTIGSHVPNNESEYETSAVFTSGKKPTWKEVLDEMPIVAKKIEDEAYVLKRIAEYPSIVEQLDTIYHNGIDEWKSQIQAIKDKYPKPSE